MTSFAQKRYSLTPVITNLWWHKVREKDVVGIVHLTWLVYFPPITLLLILQWHTGGFWEKVWCKQLKQCKIFEILLSESQVYKKWQTSAIFLEISNSYLESGRYGPKSGISWIIRDSWQPCFCLRPWNMAVNSVVAVSFF